MMYHYQTLKDKTEITHSHIIEKDGVKIVEVHFERPKEGGFDSARCILPTFRWKFREGFTDEEIEMFNKFLRENVSLLFKCAEDKQNKDSIPSDVILVQRARLAVALELKKRRALNLPIAKFNPKTKEVYIVEGDGTISFLENARYNDGDSEKKE